ncbi:hypothetical protein HOY80DRAFT_944469 [Tuber brumale]|nr:hypothetical protein HOY80DRAFT_944469 [Tuber brumale]
MKFQTPTTTFLLLLLLSSLQQATIASPVDKTEEKSTLFDPQKLNTPQREDGTSPLQRTSSMAGTKLVNNWRQAVGGIAVAVLVAVV